jgi:predicted negative regulator of RcsB-dependent stress response
MADYYVSDDEQVEAIRQWWKANGSAVITGIALGLAAVLGWQQWMAHQAGHAEQLSQHYDTLVQAVERGDAEQARQQGVTLLEQAGDSTYAALVSLQLARLAADGGDYPTAAARLQWVVSHTPTVALQDLARLRLVRVLLAQNRYDEAETQLGQVRTTGFNAEREELRGDLAVARQQPEQARAAYQAALDSKRGSRLLPLKLDNLPPPPAMADGTTAKP